MKSDLVGRLTSVYKNGDVIVYFLAPSNITMNISVSTTNTDITSPIRVTLDLFHSICRTLLHCGPTRNSVRLTNQRGSYAFNCSPFAINFCLHPTSNVCCDFKQQQ